MARSSPAALSVRDASDCPSTESSAYSCPRLCPVRTSFYDHKLAVLPKFDLRVERHRMLRIIRNRKDDRREHQALTFFSRNQSGGCRRAGEYLGCQIVFKSWSRSALCHGNNGTSDRSHNGLRDGIRFSGTCDQPHANSFDRILPATAFPRSPTSPIGPTQLGHPESHPHEASRPAAPSISLRRCRYKAALCPIPPG